MQNSLNKNNFNIGDTVFLIVNKRNHIDKICELCKGCGLVRIENSEKCVSCPDCYGNGRIASECYQKWKTEADGVVNKI